ncbi:hypothetical protein JAAARDRAFT_33865, partial [Jaapia argillacea MUCL 33604]
MATLSIHNAAQNKQFYLVRSLVTGDPKLVDALDADQRTPLHWAASSGSVEITQYLLNQNAEVDKPDNSGWTPLHIAVSAGNDGVVRELIGAGADVKKTNDKGITPL